MIAKILLHERNKARVDLMVAHCWHLDGTRIDVVDVRGKFRDMVYPEICNASFLHLYAHACQPFFFLEDDSIPLKPGWLSSMECEFVKGGKPFMLSIDRQTPYDMSCGIGVYDPSGFKEFPPGISGDGWDGWMTKWRRPLIHHTHLIQHSYGNYRSGDLAEGWEFPRDQWIIRNTTLVFHKDATQSLIPAIL